MPFCTRHSKKGYTVYNCNTGHVYGHNMSEHNKNAQLRILHASTKGEHSVHKSHSRAYKK